MKPNSRSRTDAASGAAFYKLVHIPSGRVFFYPDLPSLATACYLLAEQQRQGHDTESARAWAGASLWLASAGNKPLPAADFYRWGQRLVHEQRPRSSYFLALARPVPGYTRRFGPVPGVHKHRGYGAWYRAPHTAAERRDNDFCHDVGEPGARPSRSGLNLPSDRDDLARCCQRSWKSQHKGRKSWDRR